MLLRTSSELLARSKKLLRRTSELLASSPLLLATSAGLRPSSTVLVARSKGVVRRVQSGSVSNFVFEAIVDGSRPRPGSIDGSHFVTAGMKRSPYRMANWFIAAFQ